MRFLGLSFAAVLAGLAAPGFAQDGATVIVSPSTPWQVDFGENKCRAVRLFGEGDERTVLLLEQITPSDTPRWIMAGEVAEQLNSGGDLTVQFGPGVEAFEMSATKSTTLGEFGKAYRSFSIRKPDWEWGGKREEGEADNPDDEANSKPGMAMLDIEEGASIEWVQFSRGKRAPQRLATGDFGQLFSLLNTCMTDLVRTWGVDVEAQQRRAKGPKPLNINQIARRIQQYYPIRAERWGKQADLSIRMLIDESGAITDCRITNITIAEDFDDRACIEFRKVGKFEPAIDTDGKPMASFYASTILYRLH